jgi:hypothetical protein
VAKVYFGGVLMNMQDLLKAVIPILVACIAWLLGQVSSFQERLTKIEGKMPALITNEGVPTDSPISAEARNKLKEEINNKIGELNVRIRILEEHDKDRK